MERKTFILLLIGATIFLITATLSVLVAKEAPLSPTQASLETCNTLKYNGENKEDLLFFADEKTSQSYADFLFQRQPFNEREKDFNVYYISNYQPTCQLYKGIALYCPSKELTEKASSCPHDFIIVIEKRPSDIRSSAHLNVASINKALSKTVLIHEIGHLFGLDEEYNAGYTPSLLSPNCKISCDKFGQYKDSCYQECASPSFYRSVENGVMRTLSPDDDLNPYGDFNNEVISSKIIEHQRPITGLAISTTEECSQQSYILIEAIYQDGEIIVLSKEKRQGCPSGNNGGLLYYVIKDSSGIIIEKKTFNPQFIFTDIQQEILTGQTYNVENSFYLAIPNIQQAQTIEFFDENNQNIGGESLNDFGSSPCKI